MLKFLVITDRLSYRFSGTTTNSTITFFQFTSLTRWTGQSPFSIASITFIEFYNVENIPFGDHPTGSTSTAAYNSDPFAIATGLLNLLSSVTRFTGLKTVALGIAQLTLVDLP